MNETPIGDLTDRQVLILRLLREHEKLPLIVVLEELGAVATREGVVPDEVAQDLRVLVNGCLIEWDPLPMNYDPLDPPYTASLDNCSLYATDPGRAFHLE